MARRLRQDLRAALKSARPGTRTAFLELFAGVGNLSRHLRRRGHAVVSLDIRHGPHHGLSSNEVYAVVKGWLQSGMLWGLWCGTPCSSFSRARRAPPGSSMPGALRDRLHVRGLPGLVGKDLAGARLGNLLADRAGVLARMAYDRNLAGGEENPASSFLWLLRSRELFLRRPRVADAVVDYCSCGTSFRARTRLRLWHWAPPPALLKLRCSGRGVCAFSGEAHRHLTGADKGGFLTLQKNHYPDKLCRLLASGLTTAQGCRAASLRWAHVR